MPGKGVTAGTRRLLLNLVLGVILLGVIGIVLLTREAPQPIQTLYDASMGNDITRIDIELANGDNVETIQLINQALPAQNASPSPSSSSADAQQKTQKRAWQITHPIEAPADPARIQHLLTLLTDPVTKTYPAADQPLQRFGLDKPQVSVSFNGVELKLGDYNDVVQARYVLKGDTLYLISETVYSLLQAGVNGFIRKHAESSGADTTTSN